MSSVHFEGDNNRGAGRDYYEHYERHEHFYHGEGEASFAPFTDGDLLLELHTVSKKCRQAQLRRVFNLPYLTMVTLVFLSFVALGVFVSDLGAALIGERGSMLYVPIVLIAAMLLVNFLGRHRLWVIRQQAFEADEELRAIKMEIARRRFR